MSNIRSRHVNDEATKLTKRYSNEYEKVVRLMQQTVLQKKKQIARDVKTIIEYIISDFKNAVSNDYKNRTTSTSSKLKNVELKRKDERLIENVSKIALSESEYVSSSSIRSISLSDKKITASLKKSLMNILNTLTSPFRTARSIFSKFVQFVVRFSNLSPQSTSKIIEKQTEKVLHEELKSPFAKEKILSSRKTVVDDRS